MTCFIRVRIGDFKYKGTSVIALQRHDKFPNVCHYSDHQRPCQGILNSTYRHLLQTSRGRLSFPEEVPGRMKALRIILIGVCCFGIGYGYWGAFTESGNKKYEGMAALLPYYIMLASAGLLSIFGLYYLVIFMIKRSTK